MEVESGPHLFEQRWQIDFLTTPITSKVNVSRDVERSKIAQQVAMLITIIISVIILVIRIVYRRIPWYKNVDVPHFGYVLRFIFQIVDVFSDIFACEWMYANNDSNYFFCSLTFLILPFVISLLFFIYFKFIKFNNNTLKAYPASKRITEYFDQHWISLLLWCILSFNFYSGITLAQSQMFCLSMFNLQLKHEEFESLAIVKFINGTLCENIGQIIIQILYLQHIDDDNSLLIYISLTFSIFSILSQITIFLTQLNNILIKYNKHVTQIISFDVKITLHCSSFQSKHEYTNNSIEKSLINAFTISDESEIWSDRGDVNVKYQVYYVDGKSLTTNHEMDVYFNVTVSCYNDIDNKIETAVESTINKFAKDSSSKIQKQFIKNVKKRLGMKQRTRMKILSNEFEIINKDVINNELKNGVLLSLSIWRANVVERFANFTPAVQDLPQQPKISQDIINIELAMTTTGGAVDEDDCDDGEGHDIEGDDNHTITGHGSQVNIGNENGVGENKYDDKDYHDQVKSEGFATRTERIRSNSGSELLNEFEVVDGTTSSKT